MSKTLQIVSNADILARSGILAEGASVSHGQVIAANASRFAAAHLSQPLTDYATGTMEASDLLAILNGLVPSVPVPRRFSFKKQTETEQFLAENGDDIRAVGAAFKRVEYSGDTVDSRTFNKGLTIRIDHDEEDAEDPQLQERYTRMLTDRLLRAEINRVVSILDANDTNANLTWNPAGSPLVNPYTGLRASIRASLAATGVRPNKVVFGGTAWDYLNDQVEASEGAFGTNELTPERLRAKLQVESVQVLDTYFQSSASAKSAALAGVIFCYYKQDNITRDDPSHIKRFVTQVSGGPVRVYVDEKDKFTDITVEHYSNIVATRTSGIRKNTVAQS